MGAVEGPQFQASSLEVPGTQAVNPPASDAAAFAASLVAAGWSDEKRMEIEPGVYESLRWSNLRTLLAARDQVLARGFGRDPAAAMRTAWLDEPAPDGRGSRSQAARTPIELRSADGGVWTRVLLLGDTGDRSQAQRAVAQRLRGRASNPGLVEGSGTPAALIIESDIIYPAGAENEYDPKFFAMYGELRELGIPIYAVPGNHDWNDGALAGFMNVFCGARTVPRSVHEARSDAAGGGLRRRLADRHLWHLSSADALADRPCRPAPTPQPAPYVVLSVDGVLFVGVDTGYGDTIDEEQAQWLVAVVDAHPGMPKILFSGKPLVVNGLRAPCAFQTSIGDPLVVRGADGNAYVSVDSVVRRQENGFVAALGGDIHNYQRYMVGITNPGRDERIVPYVVSGGGGAFIGQTASLPRVHHDDVVNGDEVRFFESDTMLFPRRGHSRLYLDAIIRQSRHRVRLTLPIFLAATGVIGLLAWALHLPAPHGAALVGVLTGGVAANVGARPVPGAGRLVAGTLAAAGAGLLAWGGSSDVATGSILLVVVGAFVGQLALQLAQIAWLDETKTRRLVGQIVSAIAGLAIAAASVAGLALAAGRGTSDRVVLFAILGAGVLATVAATLPVPWRITVEEARGQAEDVVAADAPPLHWWNRVVPFIASHQRVFSTYETFTDGRVDQRTTLHHARGPAEHVFLPLYRSFLEIEFRRIDAPRGDAGTGPAGDRFEFVFTALAVTGQATTEDEPSDRKKKKAGGPRIERAWAVLRLRRRRRPGTGHDERPAAREGAGAPAVIDGFRVRWGPEETTVDPHPAMAEIGPDPRRPAAERRLRPRRRFRRLRGADGGGNREPDGRPAGPT